MASRMFHGPVSAVDMLVWMQSFLTLALLWGEGSGLPHISTGRAEGLATLDQPGGPGLCAGGREFGAWMGRE